MRGGEEGGGRVGGCFLRELKRIGLSNRGWDESEGVP